MSLFFMGGWMMWPLLLVSIIVTAIIIERLLFYSVCRFPPRQLAPLLENAVQGNPGPLLAILQGNRMTRRFAELTQSAKPRKEAAVRIEGEAIIRKMERYLPTLRVLARLAPMLGLLGTVWGMIITFSQIADTQAGVNMTQLADGIWQALLTTAAGLLIAIPALFFLHQFQNRVDNTAHALTEAANALMAGGDD